MENESKDSDRWVCGRCTKHNHLVDKLCEVCRGPREISYPNIPDIIPIPEITNPYPPREFTTSQTFNPILAMSRKEVPPDRIKLENGIDRGPNSGPMSVNFSSAPQNVYVGSPKFGSGSRSLNLSQLNLEKYSQGLINDITQDKSADLSGFLTPNFSENGGQNISHSDISICDLTKDEDDSYPLDLTKENGDQTVKKFLKSGNQAKRSLDSTVDLTSSQTEDSFAMGDLNDLDFIREQSTGGFRKSDFPNDGSPLTIRKVNSQNELLHHRSNGINTNAGKSELSKTSPNWNLSAETTHGFKTTSTMLGSRHLNGPVGALDPKNWPLEDESGSLGLLYPPDLSSSDPTANIAISGASNSIPINPGVAAKKSSPSNETIFKKIMPKKNHKPMDLGVPSKNKKPKSNFEIMSLYGDVTMEEEESDHVTVSTRSATIAPPPGLLPPQGAPNNVDEFDPLSRKQQEPLNFDEEHFSVQESPKTKENTIDTPTADPVDTAPSPSTTPNISASGARRKTGPRKTPTPAQSHGPPPQAMIVDEDHSTWPCPICTYGNRLSAQYCEMCIDGKPPWHEDTPDNRTQQPAVDQSIRRDKNTNKNSKAFVEERKVGRDTSRDKERWICERLDCTKINMMKLRYCAKCGFPRQDTPPSSPEQPSTSHQASAAEPSTSIMLAPPIIDTPMLSPPIDLNQFSSVFFRDTPTASTSSNEDPHSGNKIESIMMEKLRHDQEEEAQRIFNNIEGYCREANDQFVDDQFPPLPKSLYYPTSLTRPPVEWLRPGDIRTRDTRRRWTVFCDEGPQSTDIQQGILGNCWFLSGLSALVDRQHLLRKIFLTSELNPCGVYMIRLCNDGLWQTVIVDDLLPCNKDHELLYTQAIRKQLWVPLIEKALAKVNGCYEALQAGRSIEGLATLTGAPCETVQLMPTSDQTEFDPDIVWTVLLSSKSAGFLMGASCGGANMDVNEDIYNRVDLRVRHAYGVLDVKEERAEDGTMVKLLQLRNPWAQQSWSGDWSDNSDKWRRNNRLRNMLDPTKSGHGIFWLCFTDMLRYFDSVDICKIRDTNWAETRFQGAFPNSALQPPSSYFIEVFQPTEIDFSIFQQGSRSQEGSGRHPVDLSVCVFRSTEKSASARPNTEVPLGPLVVCSRRQVKRHGVCSHFFEPGVYQVVTLAFNHWLSGFGAALNLNPSEYPKFVLALHSSRVIQLTNFTANPTLFADATIELVMKKGEQKEVRECASCYYLTRGWAGLIVVAENRHPERYLHVVCDCEESNNVVSTRGKFKTSDSVPPLHKQVLIVLTQLDGYSGFTITHKLTHRMSTKGLEDWSDYGRPSNEHEPSFSKDVVALHKPRPL